MGQDEAGIDRGEDFGRTTIPTIPTPETLVTSVTSGKTTNFVGKNAIENVYFFFTYERCRRRLPLIKMIKEERKSSYSFLRGAGLRIFVLEVPSYAFEK